MLGSYPLFSVRGVPVKIHVTTLILLPLIYSGMSGLDVAPWLRLPLTFLFVAMLLCSVGLHELGHTIVAQRYNLRVQDIILTPLGGVARLSGGLDNPRHELRIAVAGPYVSLLLALLGFASFFGVLPYNIFLLTLPVLWFAFMNTMLFLFNLIPNFPMDGGRVLRALLARKRGMLEATRIAAKVGKFFSIAFILFGLTVGRFMLIFIGLFILYAGTAEYRMMQLKTWQEQNLGLGPGTLLDPEIEVSPPPYEARGIGTEPESPLSDFWLGARDLFQEAFRSFR